jgi:hypothetical protein
MQAYLQSKGSQQDLGNLSHNPGTIFLWLEADICNNMKFSATIYFII